MLKVGSDHPPTVLFIDDDVNFIKHVKTWQASNDLEVMATAKPNELQALVKGDSVDCVVIDLRMDDFPTVSFLEVLRHERPDLETAVLTGFSPTKDESRRLKRMGTSVHYKGAPLQNFLESVASREHAETWLPKAEQPPNNRPNRASRSYHSVFISYGGPDEAMARSLHDRLTEEGVETFFFPVSSVPGRRLHRTMSEAVNSYDRVLLLCSKASLERPGVLNELEQVLAREASEGGSELLIPAALDGFVYSEWQPARKDLARQVRQRVIADLSGVSDAAELEPGINRILGALKRAP